MLVSAACGTPTAPGVVGMPDTFGSSFTASASGTVTVTGADSSSGSGGSTGTDLGQGNLLGEMLGQGLYVEAFAYGGEYGNDCSDCDEYKDKAGRRTAAANIC